MSDMAQVQQNQQLVRDMMANAQAQKAAEIIQQGNKAHIPVHIDYEADSGEHFVGDFIFRRPSPMDYIKIGATRSELLLMHGIKAQVILTGVQEQPFIESYAHVPNEVMYIITAISNMDHLIVSCPEWFKNYRNTPDPDLVGHVYTQFQRELLSFRIRRANANQGSGEATGDQAAMAGSETVRGESSEPNGGSDTTANGPATTGAHG